jgi:hypothetical protein
MVRTILGVIVGYVVMALLVFLTFSVAYLAIGADVAFKSGSFEPSLFWIVTSFVLGLIAAVVGGYTCAVIAKGRRAPQILAGIVLLLGILVAIPALRADDTRATTRSGNVSNMEAMQKARTPGWVALINPFIGAVGVLIGARLTRKSGTTEAPW